VRPTDLPARPLVLAAAALALPFIHGCAATCSTEGLTASLAALPSDTPQAAASMLAGACKQDDALAAWLAAPDAAPSQAAWDAACPGDVDPESLGAAPRINNRRAAFAACQVEATGLASEQDFVTAGGNPALALAATRSLLAEDKVDRATAVAVGKRILGEPDLSLPPVQVPQVDVAEPSDPGAATVVIDGDSVRIGQTSLTLDQVRAAPPHGPDGRQVQAVVQAGADLERVVLAAPAEQPVADLQRIVWSLGTPDRGVTLLTLATRDGAPDRPHGIELATPAEPPSVTARPGPGRGWTLYDGDVAREPVPGCPRPGATLCDPASLGSALALGRKPVAIQPTLGLTVDGWVDLARAVKVPASFDTRVDPCLQPPPGMVCIPGGAVRVGSQDSHPGDGPVLVHESTLYADRTEASVADYQACVDDNACPAVKTSAADDAPMTGLSFVQARFYCTHQGKRLPTQFEWERLARPPVVPAEPTCEVANHAGCGGDPRAVSQGTPNAWGLLNVLGNASETTGSYPQIGRETCGERCTGWDPLGFCDGAPYCKGRLTRVIKGGSTAQGADSMAPEWRDIVHKKRSVAGLGARCVSDQPILHTFPPAWSQSPPPAPDAPPALTSEQLAVLDAIEEDRIDEIPECSDGRRGSSQVDCKDPTHYIYPNEDRGFITYPYIENRGGALLGVGSDQNYTFAAIARSELVFLMDYDAIVVHIHRVNQAFIKHEESPDGFVERWNPENRAESLEIIAKEWEGDPMASVYQRTLRSLNNIMYRHYKRTRAPSESGQTSWLRDEAKYDYVRDLWQKGRIRTLKGDMLGPNAMMGVGKALHELGVPMRIYYTSNAPNAWGGAMTPEYKRNVLSFPMDEQSVVLQALGWTNEFGQTGHWHFNVQDGLEAQERLSREGYAWLWQVVRPYRATDDVDLTLSGLRGTWEDAHAE